MQLNSIPIACLILGAALIAQDQVASGVYTQRIEVKLVEGCGAILAKGSLSSRSHVDLSSVQTQFDRGEAEPLIPLPSATLDRWHRTANAGGGATVGHLGLWFRVRGENARSTRSILRELRLLDLVETAYLERVPELAGGVDLAPKTPAYAASQLYAGPAPKGIQADPAHCILGGRGRGVRLTDMESTWLGVHEDLAAFDRKGVFVGKTSLSTTSSNAHHGTAVAGEIVGDRNAWGVRGISDLVDFHVASFHDGGVAAAIARAVNASGRGDIVLLEVHYNSSVGYLPAEYVAANFNVILTATKLGVHICEAAGNGKVNLDTLAVGGPKGYLDPSSSKFRDSGAIMIGATTGDKTTRAGFSNYGRRITSNGWGYLVYTTGYGDLFNAGGDIRQYYTRAFAGTSSASPIVAAAVACLVGAVRFQDDRTLSIADVRRLLRKYGTACTGAIGTRPNLQQMLKNQKLPDGLRQSKEGYALGETYTLDLSGPSSGSMALFLGTKIRKSSIGLNRRFHLDLATVLPMGIFKLPYQLKVVVPKLNTLKGLEFFFQGIRADAQSQNLHVTSSTQGYIR